MQLRLWYYIIHAVERPFARGASSPFVKLEMMASVLSAIPIDIANHSKRLKGK
jgi:hypothetical protein